MKKTLLLICSLVTWFGAWSQEPTNLATSGTATASFANGDAHLSNDGNNGTRWGSNGGADTEWYQIAWASPQTFNTVKILCEGAMNVGNAPLLAFDIQVSNDGTNWTNKKHIWGQNANGGEYLTVVFNEPATAQYVRFQGVKKGTYGYSFWEFEVYNIDYSAKELNSIALSSYLNETSTNAGRTIALSVIGKTADEEIIPTGAITWNNSASSVGTVSNETFSSLTSGETTVSATAGGKTSSEITFTVTAPQVLGSIELPYRIWSATQGQGGISVSAFDTAGNPFEGEFTLSWDGSAPIGSVIDGKNLTFGAASGANTYTLKATSGVTEITTPVYMIGTNPDDPTADAVDVLPIYCGKYSTEDYEGWEANWERGFGRRDIVAINGNNCVRIHNVGTYGFRYPDVDLTQYTTLKFDIYTTEVTTGFVKIEKTNINNKEFTTAAGAWKTIEIDLTGLAVTDGNRWIDIYVGSNSTDKNRDVLIDNVYFENEIPVVPTTSITVTAPAATVAVGKTLQLTVKNQGNNTLDPSGITFESSDDTKASVSVDGVVTGVAEGDVTITATVKGSDPAISNTINLTVVPAPIGQTYTNSTHEILVQALHYTGTFDYELIITSEEAMTGFGGCYWKLNGAAGGTLMSSADIVFTDGGKTMTVNVRSTVAPIMDTPLYIMMPGEVSFTEQPGGTNPSYDWKEVASGKTYDVMMNGNNAAVIGTISASNLSDFQTSVGNASIIDMSGATIANDINELTTNNANAIFDYKTSEAAAAATKTTNNVYYADVRFYGAPNGLTFVDDPANVPLLPIKAYSAIGSGKSVVINRSIPANNYVTTYMGVNAGGGMFATLETGLVAYELTAAETGQLTFTKVEGDITTGKGYVIHNTTANALTLTWQTKNADQVYLDESNQNEASVVAINGVKILGTLRTITTDGDQWLFSGGAIKKGKGVKISPYRAYFTGVTAATLARAIFIDDEGTTKVGVINANGEIETGEFYNLRGQRVQNPTKGLYIVNGKKVFIK